MAEASAIAAEQLRAFVERIERLEDEKSALAADIREVFAEAKGTGFDTKILRRLITLRKMDPSDREEQDALLDIYRQAVGL